MLLSAFAAPLLVAAGILSLWLAPRWRVFGVTSLAVAASLGVLAVLTYTLYSLHVQSSVALIAAFIGAPMVSYGAAHLVAAKRYAFTMTQLAVGMLGGLVPLFFVGTYLWLLVGCSVARECL